MKKTVLIFTLFVFCACIQAQTKFQKIFQTTGYEKFSGLAKTSNGYIAAGVTNSYGAGQNDVFVVRTNMSGDTIWTRTFGGFYNEEAYNVLRTSDDNYLVAGYTSSYSNYTSDPANFFVLKISPNGDLLWARSFGGPGTDIAQNMIETMEHDYLITGTTNSIGAGSKDVYLLKLSVTGNYIWSKSLGATGNEIATDAIELGDKSLIIIGKTSSFGLGGYVPFVLKTNPVGDYLWAKTYDMPGSYSPKNITCNDIIRGYTNDFLFVGAKGLGNVAGDAQHYIVDIDSLGNLNWAKYYLMNSGNSEASSIDKSSTGGFIVGGWMGNYYPAVLCVDAIGQRLWSWVYNSPLGSYTQGKGFKILTAPDGGYITAGMRYNTGDTAAVLFKTDNAGLFSCPYNAPSSTVTNALTINIASQTFTSSMANITLINTCEVHRNSFSYLTYCSEVGISAIDNPTPITVFPNPSNGLLQVLSGKTGINFIEVYNSQGQLVCKKKFNGEKEVQLDITDLPNGIYLLKHVNTDNLTSTKKFIKNK